MKKYYYESGFCKATGYVCLCAVLYELRDDKRYHKCDMGCLSKKDNCSADCEVFKKAMEMIPLDKE